jgi:hypothetical protein
MKEFKDRLISIKNNQAKLMKEYQVLINEYESHDLINENQTLRQQYEDYKLRLSELQRKYKLKDEENTKLRVSLSEQIMDEKLNMIKISGEKLDTYFAAAEQGHTNRLSTYENEAKKKLEQLMHRATAELGDEKQEFIIKLEQLSDELIQQIVAHRERLAEEERKQRLDAKEGLGQLAAEDVSEEVMQKRIKQNQMEMKVGLNWINKLGILLIILGVGAAFRYSYSTWFNDYAKGSLFFLLGALMLAGGEWLFRKQKQTFALGLLGGGISILYGSIFYSYFLLEIIGLYAGLTLSVLVSLTAVLLSLRYQSRTVCALGLIGGYLPLFSYAWAIGLEGNAIYAAMGYLFLLNLVILLVSLRKQWTVISYISFAFNAPSMIALVLLAPSETIGMLYSVLTFAMYAAITLAYPFQYKMKLSIADVCLLALNTLMSCGVLYGLMVKAELQDYMGLLALIFCLFYIGLGRFIEKVMKQEKATMMLFYATSLTFAILMIPFQLGVKWLSIGWLVEGVVLILFGRVNQLKNLERAGWGIFLLCLGAFYLWDVAIMEVMVGEGVYFDLKYGSVMVGMLLVTLFYALGGKWAGSALHPLEERAIKVFKYFTLANLWVYLLVESNKLYDRWVPGSLYQFDFYEVMLAAMLTIGLAYGLSRTSVLYDKIVNYYTWFLYVVGYVMCLSITLNEPVLRSNYADNSAAEYFALVLLIGFNILVFFSGRDFLLSVLRRGYRNMEMYPVILGVYLLGVATVFLNVQFRLGEVSLLFSFLYLLLAIGYIVYGFRYKYVYIRRLGLGLTLFATAKLVFYDLSSLSAGGKIIGYFCFGLVLLGISYVYQKVSSKLEVPNVPIKTRSQTFGQEPEADEQPDSELDAGSDPTKTDPKD